MAVLRNIGNLSQMLLQQRLQQQAQEESQTRQFANQRQNMAPELVRFMSEHPESADALNSVGSQMGLNLSSGVPNNAKLLSGVREGVMKDPYSASEASIARDVAPLGRGLSEPVAGQTERYNTTPDPTALPSRAMGPDSRPEIKDLLAQAAESKANQEAEVERKLGIAGRSAFSQGYNQTAGADQAVHEAAPAKIEDLIAQRQQTDPMDINKAVQTAGQSSGAEFDATHTPERMRAGAVETGLKAGASEAAQFPYQQKLAQTRADLSLSNQTQMDDYRRSHPKATSASLDQKAGADHALSMIGDVRALADEMDKRGLLGAIAGRGAELAAGSIKSEQVFKRPEDAQLAAQFFSEMGLLQKLTARVHGGVRAAASPLMAQQFDKILSGIGDRSILEGQLSAVEQVMKTYAENPDAPALLNIPGFQPNAPQNQSGPPSIDPSILELLNRKR